jgi:hypothetical protein
MKSILSHSLKSLLCLSAGTIALSLSATAAQANSISLNPGFGSTEVTGTAGGNTSIKDIAGRSETSTGSCTGFTGSQPDHVLRLNSAFKDLTVLVQSGADTTLVVKGPGGTWCNDDFQGKNPGLDGQWQAGEYRLWIGTQGRNQSIGYTLRVSQD